MRNGKKVKKKREGQNMMEQLTPMNKNTKATTIEKSKRNKKRRKIS